MKQGNLGDMEMGFEVLKFRTPYWPAVDALRKSAVFSRFIYGEEGEFESHLRDKLVKGKGSLFLCKVTNDTENFRGHCFAFVNGDVLQVDFFWVDLKLKGVFRRIISELVQKVMESYPQYTTVDVPIIRRYEGQFDFYDFSDKRYRDGRGRDIIWHRFDVEVLRSVLTTETQLVHVAS